MSDPNYIKTVTDEALIRELEKRGENGPMPVELQVRLANIVGYIRPLVQVALPASPESGVQSKVPDGSRDIHQESAEGQPMSGGRFEVDEARELSPVTRDALFSTLQSRFEQYPERHKIVDWSKMKKIIEKDPNALGKILERAKVLEWGKFKTTLEANPKALWTIQKLEENGGEPDIFRVDMEGFEIGDCSKESPASRRNCDFPTAEFKAAEWGGWLMGKDQYEHLLTLGKFDEKTQSWLMRRLNEPQCGYLHVLGAFVGPGNPLHQREDRGFRCALKVDWPKEKSRPSFWKKLFKKD